MTTPSPESPYAIVATGLALCVAGGILAGIGGGIGDNDYGIVAILLAVCATLVGGVMVGVGTIAAGIRMGARYVDYERTKAPALPEGRTGASPS